MFVQKYALPFLVISLSVGCFAPVPVVSAPTPIAAPYQAPPTNNQTPTNTPTQPPPNAPPPKPAPPKPTPPKTSELLDGLTFSELASWKISGNTPMVAWSPNKSQIAVLSDYPQDPDGPKNHKRYVEIVTYGQSKTVGTITGDAYPPTWISEDALLFTCSRNFCGAGKNGVYLFDIKAGTQSPILLFKESAYLYAYPLNTGNVLIYSETSSGAKYSYRWEEWSASTKKTTLRENRAADAMLSKKELRPNSCKTNLGRLSGMASGDQIILRDSANNKQKVIAAAKVLPYYPGSTQGYPPCFTPDEDGVLYFSYNETEKANKATILQMSGYPKTEQPKAPTPPEKDMVYDMTFSEVASWAISGSTPFAAWSPGKTQLAFFSDLPQKEGAKDGKKYIEVVDLKTGKLKKLATTASDYSQPIWVNEETIAFSCSRDRCGKEKNGVYIIKTTKGAPQLIIPVKGKSSYAGIFPNKNEKLLVFVSEYADYSGTGPYPQPTNSWKEWDPSTEKVSERTDLPKSYQEPKDTLKQNNCQRYAGSLDTFSREGKMGITNNATTAEKLVAEATAFPYYQDDPDGVSPCLSESVDFLIYYSRDLKAKQNKATLMKVGGYNK